MRKLRPGEKEVFFFAVLSVLNVLPRCLACPLSSLSIAPAEVLCYRPARTIAQYMALTLDSEGELRIGGCAGPFLGSRRTSLAALDLSFLVYTTGIRPSVRMPINVKQDNTCTALSTVPGPAWVLEIRWFK